jgi:hypothetical protein
MRMNGHDECKACIRLGQYVSAGRELVPEGITPSGK